MGCGDVLLSGVWQQPGSGHVCFGKQLGCALGAGSVSSIRMRAAAGVVAVLHVTCMGLIL